MVYLKMCDIQKALAFIVGHKHWPLLFLSSQPEWYKAHMEFSQDMRSARLALADEPRSTELRSQILNNKRYLVPDLWAGSHFPNKRKETWSKPQQTRSKVKHLK